ELAVVLECPAVSARLWGDGLDGDLLPPCDGEGSAVGRAEDRGVDEAVVGSRDVDGQAALDVPDANQPVAVGGGQESAGRTEVEAGAVQPAGGREVRGAPAGRQLPHHDLFTHGPGEVLSVGTEGQRPDLTGDRRSVQADGAFRAGLPDRQLPTVPAQG